jgi:hypothetical protein
MMLPFFTIVFVAVFYMSSLYNTRQQALVTVRGCAWTYSKRACNGGREGLDPQCVPDDGERVQSGGEQMLGARIDRIFDVMQEIPVLGTAIEELFGVTFGMSVTTQVPSAFFRDGPTPVAGGYYTMCNTEERSPIDIATQIFCDMVGSLLPVC